MESTLVWSLTAFGLLGVVVSLFRIADFISLTKFSHLDNATRTDWMIWISVFVSSVVLVVLMFANIMDSIEYGIYDKEGNLMAVESYRVVRKLDLNSNQSDRLHFKYNPKHEFSPTYYSCDFIEKHTDRSCEWFVKSEEEE